ncbi:MAG: 3-deoxy-manno-octulosonate cytidylyltransferase [Planctomycetota bacterium]
MKVIAVIPARYDSTRFAGKVLARETGKYLIQHTYEQACKAKLPEKVIIATDNEKVVAAAREFGAECVLTSPDHQSGTDRIAEAVGKIADSGQRIADSDQELHAERCTLNAHEKRYTLNANDIVINLQGDEPEIDPGNVDYLARLLMDNPDCPMATLSAEFQTADQVADPNIVKVIVGRRDGDTRDEGGGTRDETARAIYFSRHPIPYDRDAAGVGKVGQYLRHLGIYAYRKEFLLQITSLPQTPLEKIEKLEQLRAIENGYSILVGKVKHTCDGIDTPEQYAEFVKRYKGRAKK